MLTNQTKIRPKSLAISHTNINGGIFNLSHVSFRFYSHKPLRLDRYNFVNTNLCYVASGCKEIGRPVFCLMPVLNARQFTSVHIFQVTTDASQSEELFHCIRVSLTLVRAVQQPTSCIKARCFLLYKCDKNDIYVLR